MSHYSERLEQQIQQCGLSTKEIKQKIAAHHIETPSWGYADSGTRFNVFKQPAAAKTLIHKLEDAATVHQYTGIASSVALHIPWDETGDWNAIIQKAGELGIKLGAINPNLFQDDDYKLGSICHPDIRIRRKSTDALLHCVEIMRQTQSKVLSLWFADGTNYPGQGHLRSRKQWMTECLQTTYNAMDPEMTLLIEYKFFEPGFYHTDIADWGMAFAVCQHLGANAKVLVDLGHHAHGVNIEHITAFLISEHKLGGFHFNNRKYADDDLTVGSINPYELFLIYNELVDAELDETLQPHIEYMIDQSHNVKPKVEAMIQSVLMCQKMYTKALVVDRKALFEAQNNGDIVKAEEILVSAFDTDVEPLLQDIRQDAGIEKNPLEAFRASGYVEKKAQERQHTQAAATLG